MSLVPKPLTRYVQRMLRRQGFEIRQLPKTSLDDFADLDDQFHRIVRSMGRDTFEMTEHTTYKTCEYLISRRIAGDLVECGVYRGRQIVMMAHTLLALGIADRNIYLYDTFAGMTEPTTADYVGNPNFAATTHEHWDSNRQPDGSNRYKFAALEDVKHTVFATGYPRERFTFVAGDVRETLGAQNHDQIAFLRLDTDWYESTRIELEQLYDRLVIGGVLVIDDYGRWRGQRKAVDEFFARLDKSAPMLIRTSAKERLCIKVR